MDEVAVLLLSLRKGALLLVMRSIWDKLLIPWQAIRFLRSDMR